MNTPLINILLVIAIVCLIAAVCVGLHRPKFTTYTKQWETPEGDIMIATITVDSGQRVVFPNPPR